jgi:hypothetical protein
LPNPHFLREIGAPITKVVVALFNKVAHFNSPSQPRTISRLYKFSRHSLEKALDAYDLHKAKPELTLWQIAQQLRLSVGQALNKDELAKGRGVDKKRILAIAAHKKLALAKKIVDGVGRGVFPAIATRKGLGKNHR